MSVPYGQRNADGVMTLDPALLRRIPCQKNRATAKQRRPVVSEREVLALVIEALIARLDKLDGDPDLEDSHDAEETQEDREPSHNAPVSGRSPAPGAVGATADDVCSEPPEAPPGYVAIRVIR